MSSEPRPTGLARRERTGSEKRRIGIRNIARMLPQSANGRLDGEAPPNIFAADLSLMSMEDSYCDMWDRSETIDPRTRSLFNVSLMVAVGNVGNQFELGWHAPGAIHNGVTIEELEAIVVHARAFVGSPASAWAMMSIVKALTEQGLMKAEFPAPDKARREKTGSEKRAIGRATLRAMAPDSELIDVPETMPVDGFAAELDYMMIENVWFDLWSRTDDLDRRSRLVVTLGLLMGLGIEEDLAEFVPIALRSGLTVPELEEFVYQAATYLGYPAGRRLRRIIGAAIPAA
ncbi:MAG: carboxymuconolactone decarboxylase family protein [Sphingobium sp.]